MIDYSDLYIGQQIFYTSPNGRGSCACEITVVHPPGGQYVAEGIWIAHPANTHTLATIGGTAYFLSGHLKDCILLNQPLQPVGLTFDDFAKQLDPYVRK